MLTINNIYGHGFERSDLDTMQQVGFQFRPKVSFFAGAQKLHFIDFLSCPCLELIEVNNHEAYLDFVPPGMTPYAPGINLGIAEPSSKTIQDYQVEFADWEPYLLHENYEGDPEDFQPSWNYLNFRQEVVPGTFIWITEPDLPKPASNPKVDQPNRVVDISGLIFDLNEKEINRLSTLIGSPFKDGILNLAGVNIYSKKSSPLDGPLSGKEFSLSGIILKAGDLSHFSREEAILQETTINNNPALCLETPPQSWNIYITC